MERKSHEAGVRTPNSKTSLIRNHNEICVAIKNKYWNDHCQNNWIEVYVNSFISSYSHLSFNDSFLYIESKKLFDEEKWLIGLDWSDNQRSTSQPLMRVMMTNFHLYSNLNLPKSDGLTNGRTDGWLIVCLFVWLVGQTDGYQ